MISTGGQATPTTTAKRVKRWIVQSIASAPRKAREFKERRRVASDATVTAYTLAAVFLGHTRKNAHKATHPGSVACDVVPPSETKTSHSHSTDSTGLSGPPSVPCDGHADSEPASVPSPLSSPSPPPSDPPREDSISAHTPSVGQSPDEDAQAKVTEARSEPEPEHAGDTGNPWHLAPEEWDQWGVPGTTPAFDGQEPQDPPEYGSPTAAESEGVSMSLAPPDGGMTLTLRNFLGAGAFGKVVSADWEEGQRQVAVKISHKLYISEFDWTEVALRHVKNELDVLKALKQSRENGVLGSKFFPELFRSWQDDKNVYFVMDLYPWDLERLRWADSDWDASPGDKILWAAEMIVGVQALHRMRILHRDIKPENIFITARKHLIIGDYGLAHGWTDPFYALFPTSSLKVHDAPGTMLYIAPEVVNGFYEDPVNVTVRKYASYGFEADIWSLGVTICDSWRWGKPLFGIDKEEEDQDPDSAIPPKILKMDIESAVKEIVDCHPIWHLITRMLDRDPTTRIGFNDILAHPVFAHLDWNKVASLEYTPTWNFPEANPSKEPKPVEEGIAFRSFYQPPEDIYVGGMDSGQATAENLNKRGRQILRRAMGATRDWVGEQDAAIKNKVLGQYDFDWTAQDLTDED